jgi:hypothetical protein
MVEHTIEVIAKHWIDLGGDSDGVLWSYRQLYDEVKRLEDEGYGR